MRLLPGFGIMCSLPACVPQGLTWYAAGLRQDKDGDYAHEFISADAAGSRATKKVRRHPLHSVQQLQHVGQVCSMWLQHCCVSRCRSTAAARHAGCLNA
jgi:hypothetical protein